MHITKTSRTPQTQKCIYVIFIFFKFPVDCDAMMHVLKDFINLKYSELLTEEISKSN